MTESCTILLNKSITSKGSYWLSVKVEWKSYGTEEKLSLLGESCCYHSQSWRKRTKQILQKFGLAFFMAVFIKPAPDLTTHKYQRKLHRHIMCTPVVQYVREARVAIFIFLCLKLL